VREFSAKVNSQGCVLSDSELAAFPAYVEQVYKYSEYYRKLVAQHVSGSLTQWRTYLRRLHHSTNWLQYPRTLFDNRHVRAKGQAQGHIESDITEHNQRVDRRDEVDFAVFIDLLEAESLWSWNRTFLERLLFIKQFSKCITAVNRRTMRKTN
jgi:hypothetical protein